jgi:hypothetical protein
MSENREPKRPDMRATAESVNIAKAAERAMPNKNVPNAPKTDGERAFAIEIYRNIAYGFLFKCPEKELQWAQDFAKSCPATQKLFLAEYDTCDTDAERNNILDIAYGVLGAFWCPKGERATAIENSVTGFGIAIRYNIDVIGNADFYAELFNAVETDIKGWKYAADFTAHVKELVAKWKECLKRVVGI